MQSDHVDHVNLFDLFNSILSCVEVFDLAEWSWVVFISYSDNMHIRLK